MAQSVARPVSDGHRQIFAEIADMCEQGAVDLREARHERVHQHQAMLHASIDAEQLLARIADRARRGRR